MICPNCGDKYSAVIVYGYCEDENGNEYPFDPRVYEAGCSLPAWGRNKITDKWRKKASMWGYEEWPTRFCYNCRNKFHYLPEDQAMYTSYEEALRIANEQNMRMTQWEAIELMQEVFPHQEFGWVGYAIVSFDRVIFGEEEVNIEVHTE